MKKILLSLFLIVPGLMATAQQISVNNVTDTTHYYCTMPLTTQFTIGGTASGYNTGDLITYTLETGDGTVYTQTQSAASAFNAYINHTYTSHGNYTVKYKAAIPGAADSIVIPNNILAEVCTQLSGTVYRDANGNCVRDPGEPVIPNISVGLIAPGETNPSHTGYSNSSGSYSISAPTSSNIFTVSYYGNSSCSVQGSQVSVPGTLDIPLTGSVYFMYASSNPNVVCLSDSTVFSGSIYKYGLGATDTIFITIHFGDGTSQSIIRTGNQSGNFSTTHNYSAPGTYQAVYTLSAAGQTDTMLVTNQNLVYICGNVTGTIYHDSDQDCIKDAGEPVVPNSYVVAYDPAMYLVGTSTTDQNGEYSILLPAGTTYTIKAYPPSAGYVKTCPASGEHVVSSLPSVNDFALDCQLGFDLRAFASNNCIVPGMQSSFNFFATNFTCNQSPGTLEVIFDQTHLTIDSFSVTPTSISGNVFTWTFPGGNISPVIYAHADTTLQLGDTLCFPVTVTPITGDFNSANNTYYLCKIVSSSYDPNMKEGWHGIGSEGYIKQETTLDYTIHFQNTGTAPAMNIYIRDTLPSELDPSTLEIIGASHPFNWYSWQGNQLKFEFNNINLPDSNSNEPASKGFVMYRIKTVPNLPHGSKIENGAAIYFDYNEPVITNKTLHTIDIFLNVDENGPESKLAELYPNPSSGYVYVDFKGKEGIVTLNSITGSEVKTMSLRNGINTLELDKLSPGIYFFTIRSGEEVMSGKMIKQ